MIEPDWFHPREECGDCGSTRADAQALADVRTLDGFGDWEVLPGPRVCTPESTCVVHERAFTAATPDAARCAAAAWVREQAKGAPPVTTDLYRKSNAITRPRW